MYKCLFCLFGKYCVGMIALHLNQWSSRLELALSDIQCEFKSVHNNVS